MSPNNQILAACQNGNLSELESLLATEKEQVDLQTMLGTATRHNQASTMRFLFKRSTDAPAMVTRQVIIDAIDGGLDAFKVLVEQKAEAITGSLGHMGDPLASVAMKGDIAFTTFLLSKGANPNQSELFGRPIIATASGNSTPEIVRLLLENGANIKATDALLMAVWHSRSDNLKLLLEYGAEVDELQDRGARFTQEKDFYGAPALHIATSRGEKDCVRLLLSYGANPDLIGLDGRTAIGRATEKGDASIMELLESQKSK
jgi:hypothetical protein